jgi:rfaE bifunctional protein nucleotidyltransferase chain/domain
MLNGLDLTGSMAFQKITDKIVDAVDARRQIDRWQQLGHEVVFTNGCFDILHTGHISYLAAARDLGQYLVVGLNSSASVKRLKGSDRPINDTPDRALLLAALTMVDLVVVFEEDTPLVLLTELLPDILVKGGDYIVEEIVGYELITQHGGRVLTLPFVAGYSSTGIINKMKPAT